MNIVDIILIALNVIIIIVGIISIPMAIKNKNNWNSSWDLICYGIWIIYLCFGWTIILPFIVVDKHSGQTIGKITSVDKNFWGTTALYIKTIENNEEKYCIEFDEELEEKANKLIGKEVVIKYGERVGIYSTGKCHEAPVDYIGELEDGR